MNVSSSGRYFKIDSDAHKLRIKNMKIYLYVHDNTTIIYIYVHN